MTMMYGLTPAQKRLLDFIKSYMDESGGVPPTYQEMGAAIGLKSKSSVHRLVHGLKQRGHISMLPGMRQSLYLPEKRV